ncbi:PLD nuclease N-terminal domain-containing protein [Pseudohaliea sp.]|uniref:PLD nuclease N-terminal domain-containing protein n=1 Tax=Pseudohaliea sp. TaxID=2740289 RepID=UPI0032EEBAB7
MDMPFGGLIGLLILIADIWAIINVIQARTELVAKLLWIVLIVVLPLLGVIIWYFAGPRASKL